MPRATDPRPVHRNDRSNNFCPYCRCPVPRLDTGAGKRGRYCSIEHQFRHLSETRQAEIRETALLRLNPGIRRPARARRP